MVTNGSRNFTFASRMFCGGTDSDVKEKPMQVTLEIPDDLAGELGATAGELSRLALEALALEEYKANHLTEAQLIRLLGFSTRYELDGFFKEHDVWADYTIEDLHRELRDLETLGL